jgi:hypothetical protein
MGAELEWVKSSILVTFHPLEQRFHRFERFVIRLNESYQSIFGRMIFVVGSRNCNGPQDLECLV